MAMVIDAEDWEKKGLLVLKFDKEKCWANGDGEPDTPDFEAERVSFKDDGMVEAHVGGRTFSNKIELVKKRSLGEVLIEMLLGEKGIDEFGEGVEVAEVEAGSAFEGYVGGDEWELEALNTVSEAGPDADMMDFDYAEHLKQ